MKSSIIDEEESDEVNDVCQTHNYWLLTQLTVLSKNIRLGSGSWSLAFLQNELKYDEILRRVFG